MGWIKSGWHGYLLEAVEGYVLSASDGVVAADLASWLVTVVEGADPKFAAAPARAIVSEAEEVDEALHALAKVRMPKVAAVLGEHSANGLSYSWDGIPLGAALIVRLDTCSLPPCPIKLSRACVAYLAAHHRARLYACATCSGGFLASCMT